MEGDFREKIMEPLAIPPAVAQMQDHMGKLQINGAHHVFQIAVGVRKNQNFHEEAPLLEFSSVYAVLLGLATGKLTGWMWLARPADDRGCQNENRDRDSPNCVPPDSTLTGTPGVGT